MNITLILFSLACQPVAAEGFKNPEPALVGHIKYHDGRFAIYNWEARQIAFFDLPKGGQIFMSRSGQPDRLWDRETYTSDRQFGVCPQSGFNAELKSCSQLEFPAPLRVIKTQAFLQVKGAPGITNKSPLLLLSTELYRGEENTGLNPPADAFYAVYDLSGKEVYRFPHPKLSSTTVVSTIAFDPAVPIAVFGIGGLLQTCNAEESPFVPAWVREVFIWEPPKKVRRLSTKTKTPEVEKLMQRFGLSDWLFFFLKLPKNYDPNGC